MSNNNLPNLQNNIDLKAYSTFGISSIAKEFITVDSYDTLFTTLEFCQRQNIAYRIIGSGSNIVLPDEGISELVIRITGCNIQVKNNFIVSDSGVLLGNLVKTAMERNLAGLELLSGIPGTIGGAVVGNAGAYGRSISDVIDWVEVWNGEKKLRLSHSQCLFSYRNSIFKHSALIILRVKIQLLSNERENLKEVSENIIKLRAEKYPIGIKSPGSFFKNISLETAHSDLLKKIDHSQIKGGKIPVGYLLDTVQAKGMRMGDIQVSPNHGNLIINTGKGKTEDVKKLSRILKEKVKSRFNTELEEEVRYW